MTKKPKAPKPEKDMVKGWRCSWCRESMEPIGKIWSHECTKVPKHVLEAEKMR